MISASPNAAWVFALKPVSNEALLVGGYFSLAGDLPNVNLARYNIEGIGPAITLNPGGTSVCATESAVFAVSVAGTGPLGYQWQIKNTSIPNLWMDITDGPISNGEHNLGVASGANTSTLTISEAVDSGLAIDAAFRCVVTNVCGSATSVDATLAVFPRGTGDGDSNGAVDGRDIPIFVKILVSGAGGPDQAYCAMDMNGSNDVDAADMMQFVERLLQP